jgi:arabinoxylan arabinofuranohydrolase
MLGQYYSKLQSIALSLCFAVIALLVGCQAKERSTKVDTEESEFYLFVYFTGNDQPEEAIHYALSEDGFHYKALNGNQPIISSKEISLTGGVRDPHILRGVDNKSFYMVATDMVSANGWESNHGIVLLKSTDLIHWTSSTIDLKAKFSEFSNIDRAWAPQTIYDASEKKYMIYFSMHVPQGKDIIYYAYANDDFTDLSTVPKQLYYSDNNSSCIDADIIYHNNQFHLFYKDETGGGIYKAVSDQLTGNYTFVNQPMDQTSSSVEGSGIFKLNNDNGYVLMYDLYTSGAYQFTKSVDLVNFEIIEDASMDFKPRHGTVMPITKAEAERLSKQWAK